jgi:hypothetical protein
MLSHSIQTLTSSHAAQQRLPDFLQTDLSVAANNFALYNEYWISLSTFSFGKSGEQLRRNEFIPLAHPKPARNALRLHTVTREPIPGDYVYKRDPITDENVKARFHAMDPREQHIFLDNMSLTDNAQTKLDRDEASHEHEYAQRTKDDNECHALLASRISTDSACSIRLHADYHNYQACEHPYHRSLLYYRIVADLHKYGDASTKHLRTSALFHLKQDGPFPPFLSDFNSRFEQFRADFEAAANPGYVHLGELKSFLILGAVDRKQFRTVFDEQLRATPTGRFPDSTALIKTLSDYDNHHKMSLADPVSHQGSAFAASSTALPKPAQSSASQPTQSSASQLPKRLRKFPEPCPYCLQKNPKTPRYGHSGDACTSNPANKKALAAPTPADPGSAPETVASLALSQRRLEESVASLVAILSLDQAAGVDA